MIRYLIYLFFIFFTVKTYGNGFSECTLDENGFMFCPNDSPKNHEQNFLKDHNYEFETLKKRDNSSNRCINSGNDKIYKEILGFDIFCFDKISSANSLTIKGRLAAKKSISSNSFSITNSEGGNCSNHAFKYAIYTDNLTMSNGSLEGGIHYKTSCNVPDYIIQNLKYNNCEVSNSSSDNLDFDLIENKIIKLSNDLAAITSNAKVEANSQYDQTNKKLTLKRNVKSYVVEVNESTFNKNGGYAFKIDNPDNIDINEITILFNVKSTSFTLSNAGIELENYKDKVIWNMPKATEVYFNGVSIYGIVIAPKATVELMNGNFYEMFILMVIHLMVAYQILVMNQKYLKLKIMHQ
eukprot:jgi/Orpsp1_1/1185725/evm.model.c7180000094960.1